MTKPAPDLFTRYQPWRRYAEPGFWVVYYSMQATLGLWIARNNLTELSMATARYQSWEPVVWYWCSDAVLLFWVLGVVAFDRRFPLRLATLHRNLPFHVLASVVYSLTHVMAMLGLYQLAYMAHGTQYVVQNWPQRLLHEYLVDVRFYFLVIIVINFYRLLLARLQGEASLLDVPDEGPPVESIERPERFLVRKLGKEFLLSAKELEWIQASGNYVNLRVRGHDYPLRSTMTEIEKRLDPNRFIRVHRSYIANLDHVSQVKPVDTGDARASMKDGSCIPVSRRYLEALRNASAM